MRKQNPAQRLGNGSKQNPVAKFAHQFNKAQVFADKRHYKRNAKHKSAEPFAIVYRLTMANGFAA